MLRVLQIVCSILDGFSRKKIHQLLATLWELVAVVNIKPLIDAWFLRFVRSWERRMFRGSARNTPNVFLLSYGLI
jgi:hypothetical protein